MLFVLTNWIAPVPPHPWVGGGLDTNRRYKGLLVAIYFAHTLDLCYCQRGSNGGSRNSHMEVSPGLIAGIVSIVVLLAFLLAMCFLCKRCKGKKQKELDRRKRMYAIPARPVSAMSQDLQISDISQARPESPLSVPSRPTTGISRGRPMSGVSGSRPNSAVSSISTISTPRTAKPRVSHVVNDIEIIDEDNASDGPAEHPPSPFSPMEISG